MITDYFVLNEWTKRKEITPGLMATGDYTTVSNAERAWRSAVAQNNAAYIDGKAEYYIIHSNKGYKWAKDRDEIATSLNDLEKRALSMLSTVSKTRKALAVTGQGEMQNNLASLRKEAGYSGAAFVKSIKVVNPSVRIDQPTLSRIETGAVMPTPEQMIACASLLGKKPYEVFGLQALTI